MLSYVINLLFFLLLFLIFIVLYIYICNTKKYMYFV